ncbi:MAG: hypothetical protein NWQ13_08700 [Glaciimonas sp.]|nr:hypothetical protein [Glaciimonas sp.]
MRIGKYLDKLQKALDVKTDKDVAKIMGWSGGTMSNWKKGSNFMTNQVAAQVSEKIGVPVIEIIAAIEADREEVTGQRSFWTDFFQRTAAVSGMAVLALVTNLVTPPAANALPVSADIRSVYILCKIECGCDKID